jgi:SAM-dependent methyltransferase
MRDISVIGRSWRSWGKTVFSSAVRDNLAIIRRAAADAAKPGGRILDLGCWDGEPFLGYAPPGMQLLGVEADAPASELARGRGIEVITADLNQPPWPIEDASVDIITSNQVIEHLADTDCFLAEARRVLRAGGRLIVSTENLASWHNIVALFAGWQAFSLTNVSEVKAGVGNPLANLRATEPVHKGWQHQRIFSYRGLRELAEAHGFSDVEIRGAGYFPLPARTARLDPRHAAFITVIGTAG